MPQTLLTDEEVEGLKDLHELFSGRFGDDVKATLPLLEAALVGLRAETLDLSGLRALIGGPASASAFMRELDTPELRRLLDDIYAGAHQLGGGGGTHSRRTIEAIEYDLHVQRLGMQDAQQNNADAERAAARATMAAANIVELEVELEARRAAIAEVDAFNALHMRLIADVTRTIAAEKEDRERVVRAAAALSDALGDVRRFKSRQQ